MKLPSTQKGWQVGQYERRKDKNMQKAVNEWE